MREAAPAGGPGLLRGREGRHPPGAARARRRHGPDPPAPRRPRHRRSAALLRAARPARRPDPLRRAGLGHRHRPGPDRRRLARAGRRALLPGDRGRADGRGAAPPLPHPPVGRPRARRARRRDLRCGRGRSRRSWRSIGEGALLAALERARTGRMGDIVATIQAEQDEAIRAASARCPRGHRRRGHRQDRRRAPPAAYLLYTHRRRLESGGVLLVGPNTIFLRYIDQVLPSLGEEDVQLATPAGLKPKYRVVADDPPDVATIKGDVRMADVIANALRDREHPLARDTVLVLDGEVLRLRRGDVGAHRRAHAPTAGYAQREASARRACRHRAAARAVPERARSCRARRRRMGS